MSRASSKTPSCSSDAIGANPPASQEHRGYGYVSTTSELFDGRRPTLDELLIGGKGKYDFAFIDADKANYRNYFERCLKLVRKGGLIALDNTLWGGQVLNPAAADEDTRALQAFNRKLQADRRVEIALLTVGDGLTLALKR